MARQTANKILPDIIKYKQFKERSPDLKMQQMKEAAREKAKKMLLGRQKQLKAVQEGKEYKKSSKTKYEWTRQKMAELAGLSDEQLKRLEFVDKYAPELLARARGDEKVSELYNPVWGWYQTLKKHDSDLLKEVIEGKVRLKTAYEKLLKQKPSTKPLVKESPIVTALKGGRVIIEEWIKEQHNGKFEPTAAERALVREIDALIGKYTNK